MKKIILWSFLLSSCLSNTNVSSFNCNQEDFLIDKENLFKIDEEKYQVLFYLDSCSACRDTKLYLNKVCNKFKIITYYLNYKDYKFADIEVQNNIKVNNYQDIFIKTVPTLLVIYQKVVVEEYIGFNSIRNKNL